MRWPDSRTIRSFAMIIIAATMFSGSISPVSQLLGYILPVREVSPMNAVDPDFLLLQPSRTNVTLVQGGGSLSSSITATADVTLSVTFSIASTLPTGVTVSFMNNPCNTPCTVAISFSAGSTAAIGSTTVVVQAAGGGNIHTKNLSLKVYPLSAFNFALQTPSRTNVTLVQGGGSLSSSIDAISFTNMSLTFSIASTLPTGVTASFTSNSCNTNCTATVSFSASSAAATGTATVTIQAVGGGVTRTTSLSLTVYPVSAFTFRISASPSSLTVVRGSVSSSSSINAISFTNMSLTFSVTSGLPTGVTPVFTSNPCNTNCTATVSFSASSTATVGTTTVVVQGAGGSTTRTTGLSLTVYPLSVLGLDCAYGSESEATGATFPTSVTYPGPNSVTYIGPDFDGTLDTGCMATYLADTDGALHPLVSDNPSNPGVTPTGIGGGLTIDVVAALNLVTTISGFDISLKYDARVLNAVIIDQSGLLFGGTGLAPGGFVLTLAKTIDNTGGTVRIAQAVVTSPLPSGNVELFRVRFDIIAASNKSPIKIINDVLTSPGPVSHITQSLGGPGLDTTSIYNVLNSGAPLNAIANFTFSPNPEVPGSLLTFSASATCPGCTGPLTYSWDFSSSDSPTYTPKISVAGQSVTVTAPPPVVNRVTLTINDTASPVHSIRITRALPLALKESPSSIILTAGTSSGSWSGQWLGGVTTSTTGYTGRWIFCPGSALNKAVCSIPNPGFTQSGASISQAVVAGPITYNFAGVYNDTFLVRDAGGSETQLGNIASTVTVHFLANVTGTPRAFTVTITPSTSIVDKLVTLNASITYDPTYPAAFMSNNFRYSFDFGDGSPVRVVSGGTSVQVPWNYSSAGAFTVKVVAQEQDFNRAVSMIQETGFSTLTVASVLCPVSGACSFSFTPGSATVGQAVSYTAGVSGGLQPYTYSWNFGDGTSSTGAAVNHTYQSSGTFTITLTVTDSAGQSYTVSKVVTVAPGPGSPFTITSPLGLGIIAAVVALALAGTLIYTRRRRKIPTQPVVGAERS